MVALDERFQHKGTKAPRRCRRKDGFGRYSKSPTASVTQPVDFFAACEDFLGGFHQHFRCCAACGHQAGDDFTPLFRQHVTVGFGDLFD